ncbi:dethiobiotin synthase [Nitratiruptor sp. YY09-18]|uniref:dethiobiotin synthase n=1 Tax=Nitratiruptor sp. YY09-18 TaxID=2724901 RepID=UPI001916BD5D|nr:dethiobiotin synthase [Nitratiruptor sp. YY09-18]BCD67532.1 dethiobiotin synthetase [Nitratiruptor sp. YY09-18]
MRLFITATDTNVGKTYTTKKLIELAAKQGLRPGVCKPIETGVATIPLDGKELLQTCQRFNQFYKDIEVNDIVFYSFKLPAAPYVAKGEEKIDIGLISEKIEELEKSCDILFIEGAGGLMVPIEEDYYMIDLIKESKAQALLVTPSQLGCINQTLLSLEALRNRSITHYWYVNLFKDKEEFFTITYPFYKKHFGQVPLELTSVFDNYLHRD